MGDYLKDTRGPLILCVLLLFIVTISSFEIDESFLNSKEINENLTKCRIDLMRMFMNFNQSWVLQALDSFGKIESGLSIGNAWWSGNKRECWKTRSPPSKGIVNFIAGDFKGKFCFIEWQLSILENTLNRRTVNPTFTNGICIPESCEEKDFQDILPLISEYIDKDNQSKGPEIGKSTFGNSLFLDKYLSTLVTQNLEIKTIKCIPTPGIVSMSGSAIATMYLLGFLTVIVVVSTIVQYIERKSPNLIFERKKKSVFNYISRCFDAYINVAYIFDVNPYETEIKFLHSFRVLSFLCVTLGHTITTQLFVERNIFEHVNDLTNPKALNQYMTLDTAVDTFLFIGGFVRTVGYLRKQKPNRSFKAGAYQIVSRYLKITPVMLMVYFFNADIAKYLDDNQRGLELRHWTTCDNKWWIFLLSLQNFDYFNHKNTCFGWTWYLATDLQMYIMTTPIIFFLKRSQRIVRSLTWTAIVLIFLLTGYIMYTNNYISRYQSTKKCIECFYCEHCFDQEFEGFVVVHIKPYTRGFVYLFGIIYGLHFFKTEKMRKKQSFIYILLQLGLALSAFHFTLVAPSMLSNDKFITALYFPVSRLMWTLGVILLFNICATSRNSFITRLFSWRGWAPFGKLSYSYYLCHYIVIHYVYFNNDISPSYSFTQLITLYFGLCMTIYFVSFFIYFIVEAPLIKIAGLISSKYLKVD